MARPYTGQQRPQKGDGTRTNEDIRAREIRVIGDDGELIGVMTPEQGLTRAREAGLDLVEISPNAKPPVCKILDYGKYRYEQQKKASEAKKKQKIQDLKEIMMRPAIEDHDFEVKMKNANKFIDNGDKVKFVIRYRGRELSRMHLGIDILKRVLEAFGDKVKIDHPPKAEGRTAMMVVSPAK